MTRIILALLAALTFALVAWPEQASADDSKYLGRLGGNKYSPTSPNNPYAPKPPILIGK
jgi:hypothetical protein